MSNDGTGATQAGGPSRGRRHAGGEPAEGSEPANGTESAESSEPANGTEPAGDSGEKRSGRRPEGPPHARKGSLFQTAKRTLSEFKKTISPTPPPP